MLGKWCSDEDWVGQREQFQAEMRKIVQQKTLEKTSEKLSEELSEIASANYKAHRLVRDYVHAIFQMRAKDLKRIQFLSHEEQIIELKKLSPSEINYWSQVLTRSTQEISAATGLDYWINVNTSMRRIEKEGYIVVDPNENVIQTSAVVIDE
ncbi:hypothetical protein [Chlorogloeopsis fritschii]|uniref:hypothetical protein n=1 Tax=Chlorogloeopsis fritschii TaxID=1124 RepID=UPI00370D7B3C